MRVCIDAYVSWTGALTNLLVWNSILMNVRLFCVGVLSLVKVLFPAPQNRSGISEATRDLMDMNLKDIVPIAAEGGELGIHRRDVGSRHSNSGEWGGYIGYYQPQQLRDDATLASCAWRRFSSEEARRPICRLRPRSWPIRGRTA